MLFTTFVVLLSHASFPLVAGDRNTTTSFFTSNRDVSGGPPFGSGGPPPMNFTLCTQYQGLSSCGPYLPPDFCCPTATSTCISLTASFELVAALCCPFGSDCAAIAPISCVASYQNASLYPALPYHQYPTAALDVCGDGCCPWGYTCFGNGTGCARRTSASGLPVTVASATTGSGTATASIGNSTAGMTLTSSFKSPPATVSSSSTSSAAAATITIVSNSSPATNSNTLPIIGASIAIAAALGLLAGSIWLFCLFRRRRRRQGTTALSSTDKSLLSHQTSAGVYKNAHHASPAEMDAVRLFELYEADKHAGVGTKRVFEMADPHALAAILRRAPNYAHLVTHEMP